MSRQFWNELLTWITADGAAVGNTTSETILVPNVTIPANYLQDGRVLRYSVQGRISNIVTTPGNITFRLRWGGVSGTVICQSAATGMSATAFTNAIFNLAFTVQVRANGSSGSVFCIGLAHLPNLATGDRIDMGSAGATAPAAVTVDLTADTALSVTVQFQTANASNTITAHLAHIEALN